jgi:ParB family chromosome partitioning protein
MQQYEIHEAANLFPMMSEEEFDALCNDMEEGGYDNAQPIILLDGKILDGRNRYAACQKLGITPTTRNYTDSLSPFRYVIRRNLHRRHLTQSQRAALAANMLPEYEAEARERQAHGMTAPGKTLPEKIPEAIDTGDARDKAAADFGVNSHYVSDAKKIQEESQELFNALLSGEKTMGEVKNELDKDKKKPHVANNSGENEWYTPHEYIQAAREVMGEIDLDPASSDIANKIVGAKVYFTAEDDGLRYSWDGRVWMNPPYASELIGKFCTKLIYEIQITQGVDEAIVLVNNATETAWFSELISEAKAVVFTRGRVRFLDINGNPGAPLQGQAIIYFGNHTDRFINSFSKFGWAAEICKQD